MMGVDRGVLSMSGGTWGSSHCCQILSAWPLMSHYKLIFDSSAVTGLGEQVVRH